MLTKSQKIYEIITQFRVLKDWQISFDSDSSYKGQCCHNIKNKEAVIYDWVNDPNFPEPIDYLLHEVLHIAFHAAVSMDREGEELFVQDLCAYFGANGAV